MKRSPFALLRQKGSEYDWVVLKYDTTGKQLWVQRLNGAANANDYATSLKLDSQGNVIVTGTTTKGAHCLRRGQGVEGARLDN